MPSSLTNVDVIPKARPIKRVAYWATTLLGPASFVVGGVLFLTGAEQPMAAMAHLGLSPNLLKVLGVWKILGAVVCVVPGAPWLKEWAYAGFCFELSGAAALHALAGDPLFSSGPFMIAPPLFFLALVVASWALRPDDWRLPRYDPVR